MQLSRSWIRFAAVLVVWAALALAPRPASAALIGVEIVTTISQVFSIEHVLPMAVGDDVVIRFTYDDAVADVNGNAGVGSFPNAVTEASVEFPDSMLSFGFSGGISSLTTLDDQVASIFLIDSFGFAGLTSVSGDLLDGDVVSGLGFGLAQATSGVAPTLVLNEAINPPFSFGTALSASTINLSGLTSTGEAFADVINLAAGTGVLVPVPEPGMALLVGLAGLGGGMGRRRARRAR